MRFSPTALLNGLRRDKVQDPFGRDDDDFGGDSGFAVSEPKLALAVSGFLFVLLIGGVAAVIVTGQGSAVAAVSAKPVSFERLVLWMEHAVANDVIFMPMSQILTR